MLCWVKMPADELLTLTDRAAEAWPRGKSGSSEARGLPPPNSPPRRSEGSHQAEDKEEVDDESGGVTTSQTQVSANYSRALTGTHHHEVTISNYWLGIVGVKKGKGESEEGDVSHVRG